MQRNIFKDIRNSFAAVGNYIRNTLTNAVSILIFLITKTPARIRGILSHILIEAPIGIGKQIIELLKNPGKFSEWFVNALLSGAAWVGKFFIKLIDILSIGEIYDFIHQLIKVNTRGLNTTEKSEAMKVFGSSIRYWQVRIDEMSLIAKLGAVFAGSRHKIQYPGRLHMGVTTFHTINFTRKLSCSPGNSDMRWLIHELTHVAQYESAGSVYIAEALHAQATTGYRYGGPSELAGKQLRDFNREQQAEIIADYYMNVLYKSHPAENYQSYINDAQMGLF